MSVLCILLLNVTGFAGELLKFLISERFLV